MAHTYANILIHALFSTKGRHAWLNTGVREEIFRCLGGTVNELGGHSLLVNGPGDHVHMLFDQPRTLSIAAVMEKVKANSSGWVKERWPGLRGFFWQTGYAAFSVSKSRLEAVNRYIENQEEHHRRVTFQQELIAFLKKYGVVDDPRYVFD